MKMHMALPTGKRVPYFSFRNLWRLITFVAAAAKQYLVFITRTVEAQSNDDNFVFK